MQRIRNAYLISRLKMLLLLAGAVLLGVFFLDACLGLLADRWWPVVRALTAGIFYAVILSYYCSVPLPVPQEKNLRSLCLPDWLRNRLEKENVQAARRRR